VQAKSKYAVFQDDLLGSLPDVLLPSQFFEAAGAQTFSSEQRLMLAVLTDAINIMGEYRVSPNHLKRDAFDEASAWVFGNGMTGPMSFDHVCDALGVNAEALRKKLSKLDSQPGETLLRRRLKEGGRALCLTVNRIRRRRRLTRAARAHAQARLVSASNDMGSDRTIT
jgi:hypothetical protein